MADKNNNKLNSPKKRSITLSIPSKFNITYILIGLLIIAAFLIGVLFTKVQYLENAGSQPATTLGDSSIPSQLPPENTGPVTVSIDDDPFMGDENAPITMIEFSDYECPFCKRMFDETLPQLKKDYIDTGKLKFVYRDLPLGFHDPMATKEAIAANCAREQGGDEKYFQYHDEIFTRTVSNGNGLNDDDLTKIATDLDLDLNKFQSCQEDPSQADEVAKDFADAGAVGATGTPTLFIGKTTSDGNIEATMIVGAQPLATFTQVIDALLEN